MKSKEYLNEDNYDRANKRIKTASAIILAIGLLIGGGLVSYGCIKQAEADRQNSERAKAAQEEVDRNIAADKQRLGEIESEISSLQSKKDAKEQECDSLNMRDDDWFATANQCRREASSIQTEISNLEMEQFQLEHTTYTVQYDRIGEETYIPFYFIGGFVILAGIMASVTVWFITKRRAIMAYGIQSTMPVAHEAFIKTTEKLTPTASKSAGDIASSVAEGIARGTKKGKE